MRRAVSTCTSPEVFFGTSGSGQAALLTGNLPSTDPLGLAMEALQV
jgi:alpha,alpha-trehalase